MNDPLPNPWLNSPTFGTRDPSRAYTAREGAYAIITTERSQIAILKTHTGLWLPGGGLDPDETPEAALHREVMEECGAAIDARPTNLRAIEFVDAGPEGLFEKRCTFFLATFRAQPQAAPGTEIMWMSLRDAAHLLRHESQRWAAEHAYR